MSINDDWEGIKFIWKIENFSYRNGTLRSVFGTALPTAWKVGIYDHRNHINILMEKLIHTRHELSCSVAFLDSDGKSLIRKQTKESGFICFFEFFDFIELNMLDSNKTKFLPNDTLTVEIHIWRTQWLPLLFSLSKPAPCFSHVRVQDVTNVIRKRFTWNAVGVSALQYRKLFEFRREEKLGNFNWLQITLNLKEDDVFQVKFRTNFTPTRQAKIEIVILDASGTKIKFANCEYEIMSLIEERNFDSNVSKATLMRYPNQFLPADTLSLQFTCTFSQNVIDDCIVDESEILAELRRTIAEASTNSEAAACADEPEIYHPNEAQPAITILQALHSLSLVDESEIFSDFPRRTAATSQISVAAVTDKPEINKPTEPLPSNTISHALQEVLKIGFLPDFDLRVGDRVFSVHKVILGARSQVFRAMFTTEMKEKEDNCADIRDVDEDTLQRLLQFVYSDKLDENMEWERACSLYAAADKYDLEPLKQGCSSILQSGLCVSSILEVLSLADMYEDRDLMNAALEFLSLNDVIGTERWKEFEGENAKLAAETCRKLYLKKMSG